MIESKLHFFKMIVVSFHVVAVHKTPFDASSGKQRTRDWRSNAQLQPTEAFQRNVTDAEKLHSSMEHSPF
jgi:hypothetical protein